MTVCYHDGAAYHLVEGEWPEITHADPDDEYPEFYECSDASHEGLCACRTGALDYAHTLEG